MPPARSEKKYSVVPSKESAGAPSKAVLLTLAPRLTGVDQASSVLARVVTPGDVKARRDAEPWRAAEQVHAVPSRRDGGRTRAPADDVDGRSEIHRWSPLSIQSGSL